MTDTRSTTTEDIRQPGTYAADLQVHSSCSDGTDSPAELVKKAARAGLEAIALTDHDSVKGVDEALATGRQVGIQVVPAVELSLASEPERGIVDFDMLGYGIDHHAPALTETLRRVEDARIEQKIRQIHALQREGFDVPVDEVLALAKGVPGRPHIADVLWRRNRHRFRTREQIFEELLSPRSPIYVRRTFDLSAEDAIAVIRDAGGIPVLAHPGLYRLGLDDLARIVRRLKEAGLLGLEVYYPYEKTRRLRGDREGAERLITRFEKLAAELGLLVTGGSDYHGARHPEIALGEKGLTREQFDRFLQAIRSLSHGEDVSH